MARLLITGGSSYLGQHLVPLAHAAGHTVGYTTFTHDPFGRHEGRAVDMRDGPAVAALVADFRPNAILHLAGSNRSAAMTDVIVSGARHITSAAAAAGARLIHLSTDVIFDGSGSPYAEDAPPRPLHPYGRAKAEAETIVAAHADHVIVRTSLIYGLDIMDRGMEWVVAALQRGDPVTLFTNQVRCPVSAESLSHALLELVDHPHRGVLNLAGSQAISRAAFGTRLLDWWGIRERATLTLGPDDGTRFPLDVRLDCTLAQRLLQTPLPGVDAVLAARGFTAAG